MKKHILILILFSFYFSSFSQKARIATNGPCTQEMCDNVKGKWIKGENDFSQYLKLTSQQKQEALKRMDQIHDMVLEMYPNPVAVDAIRSNAIGNGHFGSLAKYYVNSDGKITSDYFKEVLVPTLRYSCGFPAYYCANDKMMEGRTNETSTFIKIFVNNLDWFAGTMQDDTMTVDRRPVKMKQSIKKTWKGYELLYAPGTENIRYVLIHRKGMLPYIPVTRKKYLDYSISYLSKLYDQLIKGFDEMPVRTLEEQDGEKNRILAKYEKDYEKDAKKMKSAKDYYLSVYQTDQQRRDDLKKKSMNDKNKALKQYQDEYEKTTADHLLDSPAIVFSMSPILDNTRKIFITEEEGGQMLVIENTSYLRKDLPSYVPQFFVLAWSWNSTPAQEKIAKIIEENFPVEKLQAMIDK